VAIRAIFFDLDDTLFPAEPVYLRGLQAAWRSYQRHSPITWPAFLKTCLQARKDVKGLLGPRPAARSRLLYLKRAVELLEGRQDPALTLELMRAYDTCWALIRAPKTAAMAKSLAREYTLGIITNQVCATQLRKLARIDPHGRIFPVLVTSEEAGVEKPHRLIFREACRRAGCLPQEALMVGNSWEADVLGARKAGMQAAYLRGKDLRRKPSPGIFILRSLEDLPSLLGPGFRRDDGLSSPRRKPGSRITNQRLLLGPGFRRDDDLNYGLHRNDDRSQGLRRNDEVDNVNKRRTRS
jgi:HAD superfamily hydrolase (TIGR01549 family)